MSLWSWETPPPEISIGISNVRLQVFRNLPPNTHSQILSGSERLLSRLQGEEALGHRLENTNPISFQGGAPQDFTVLHDLAPQILAAAGGPLIPGPLIPGLPGAEPLSPTFQGEDAADCECCIDWSFLRKLFCFNSKRSYATDSAGGMGTYSLTPRTAAPPDVATGKTWGKDFLSALSSSTLTTSHFPSMSVSGGIRPAAVRARGRRHCNEDERRQRKI